MNGSASPSTVVPLLLMEALVLSLGVLLGDRYGGRFEYLVRFAGAAAGAAATAVASWFVMGRLGDRPAALGLAILLSGPALALVLMVTISVAEKLAGRPLRGFGLLRVGATAITAALLWFIAFPALLGQSVAIMTTAWVGALGAVAAWTAAAYGPGRPQR